MSPESVCASGQVVGCIVSQLIAALAHLHKEWHRAHRDLKPGNILLDTQGGVRVTDLGQSKQMAATLGMMGSFVGAQVYMSPQRIQGASYTSACDVWSVGLIAQECLEGEFPYHKVLRSQGMEPSVDLLIEVMEEEAPPPLAPETFGQNTRDFCSAALTLAEER
jgi:serine/threonine protein kinase